MLKKCFALLLCLSVVFAFAACSKETTVNSAPAAVSNTSATLELGEIEAPYNIMYKVYDDTAAERVSISCNFTDEYAALTGSAENMAKYGIINATTYVQIDYRIDGGDWHEEQVWGTTPNTADYGGNVPGGDTARVFDLLYLVNDAAIKDAGALATKDATGKSVFDLDNHTLEFKVRTTMTYTQNGYIRVTVSKWSDVIKVERNKDFGKAPTELEAPIVYNPQVAYMEDNMPYLTFSVRTPESVKKAEAWFSTQEPTYINLQVEIDKGDGSWQSVSYASNGHYVNETKAVYLEPLDVTDVTTMKVRAYYVVYSKDGTIYSDFNKTDGVNYVEFSVPRWEDGELLSARCQVCGGCEPLFGKVCVWIVFGIAVMAAVIVGVPVKMSIDKAKAKKAAEEEMKQRKIKEERAAYDKIKKDKKNKSKKG